jgi:hypothetical protein
MAYYDGEKWQHIWWNTNEGIGSLVNYQNSFAPSAWTFLGSRVLERSSEHLVLSSLHEVVIDQVPLRIERTVDFAAGETYFHLRNRITNIGATAVSYYYYYGDEPWIGDFGSSSGDIGWVADRTVEYEERIDPQRYYFAGMVDLGSNAGGEGRNYSHAANFIAWLGPNRPNTVFFANSAEGFNHPATVRIPLRGDARSIGMFWGPRLLLPGESQTITLVIGMAERNPGGDLPTLPEIRSRTLFTPGAE